MLRFLRENLWSGWSNKPAMKQIARARAEEASKSIETIYESLYS